MPRRSAAVATSTELVVLSIRVSLRTNPFVRLVPRRTCDEPRARRRALRSGHEGRLQAQLLGPAAGLQRGLAGRCGGGQELLGALPGLQRLLVVDHKTVGLVCVHRAILPTI